MYILRGICPQRSVFMHVELPDEVTPAAPVDLRKGYDGQFGLVPTGLARDPLSGELFFRESVAQA